MHKNAKRCRKAQEGCVSVCKVPKWCGECAGLRGSWGRCMMMYKGLRKKQEECTRVNGGARRCEGNVARPRRVCEDL